MYVYIEFNIENLSENKRIYSKHNNIDKVYRGNRNRFLME